ncbi:hypothetical protein HDU76_007511 [Blyttiomyces sp. JEL0837]|nr:hypothetical protein HDU76_007511 [Blyttiomyces sp. JEL0837]
MSHVHLSIWSGGIILAYLSTGMMAEDNAPIVVTVLILFYVFLIVMIHAVLYETVAASSRSWRNKGGKWTNMVMDSWVFKVIFYGVENAVAEDHGLGVGDGGAGGGTGDKTAMVERDSKDGLDENVNVKGNSSRKLPEDVLSSVTIMEDGAGSGIRASGGQSMSTTIPKGPAIESTYIISKNQSSSLPQQNGNTTRLGFLNIPNFFPTMRWFPAGDGVRGMSKSGSYVRFDDGVDHDGTSIRDGGVDTDKAAVGVGVDDGRPRELRNVPSQDILEEVRADLLRERVATEEDVKIVAVGGDSEGGLGHRGDHEEIDGGRDEEASFSVPLQREEGTFVI